MAQAWKLIGVAVLVGAGAFALGMATERGCRKGQHLPDGGAAARVEKGNGTEPSTGSKEPESGGSHSHGSQPPMADRIDAYLHTKHSPLRGIGRPLVSYADTFGVDPRLLVAIAGAETTFGKPKATCGDHNAWNWFYCYALGTCGTAPCPNSPFDSWSQGARSVMKGLRRSYLRKGYDTIEKIQLKYCVDGCEHWVGNVTRFYVNELGGSPQDLTWPRRSAGTDVAMADGTH